MKKTVIFCLLAFVAASTFGQDQKKIKLIILGTFHFNQSLDSNSKIHFNLFTDKRQQEINDVATLLARQRPDKIFMEFTPANQPFYDSIYNDYLQGNEPQKRNTKANEVFQLGMKTAKKLGLKKLIGMNYQPLDFKDASYKPINGVDSAVRNLYIALDKYDDTTRTNAAFYDLPVPFQLPKQDSLLQVSSLKDFLLYLNSAKKLQRDEYINWNYYYSMGMGNDLSATDYVGTFWYGTNVRNFNNVLRQVDLKNDNCYLLIYGSSHIPFLKFLFQMHPYFEVVDLNTVLQ